MASPVFKPKKRKSARRTHACVQMRVAQKAYYNDTGVRKFYSVIWTGHYGWAVFSSGSFLPDARYPAGFRNCPFCAIELPLVNQVTIL